MIVRIPVMSSCVLCNAVLCRKKGFRTGVHYMTATVRARQHLLVVTSTIAIVETNIIVDIHAFTHIGRISLHPCQVLDRYVNSVENRENNTHILLYTHEL